MRKTSKPLGQSTVEFVLIAPLLFLLFFCVIQMAYTSYVALAVQRAALAVARTASLQGETDSLAFKTELAWSLMPIAGLSEKTLSTIFASKVSASLSPDGKLVTVRVEYPMPIWVPGIRQVFGQPLVPPPLPTGSPEAVAIRGIFSLLGIPAPDLSFTGLNLPVRWITFEESTFNEGFHG